MSAITGPIALYNNLPIEDQDYQPSRFVIEDIDLGQTTTVTTTEEMNYVIGQEVRLIIPPSFGSRQLNGKTGIVLSLPADDQVEINIDSSQNVDAFVASSATTVAQILAIGDINQGIQSTNGRNVGSTNIPGSFINIS